MKKITRRQFLRTSVLAGAGAALAGKGGPVEVAEEIEQAEEVTPITHSPIVHNHYEPPTDFDGAYATASYSDDQGPCDHDCENCDAYQMLWGKSHRKRCTGTREGAPVPNYFESDEYKRSFG